MDSELSVSSENRLEPPASDGYPSPAGVELAPPLRLPVRIALAGMGTVLAVLLATAAYLNPNPDGMGTHRQLGLPPCSMVQLMGMRCPACGMTTSWSHLLHGNVWASFRSNSGGALLALAALWLAPWGWLTAIRGRWFLVSPRDELVLAIGLTIASVTLVDWVVRVGPWW